MTEYPRQCNGFAHWLGRTIIRLTGWQVKGEAPAAKSALIIAAPHTSNWDVFYLLGAAYSLRVSINWLVKDTWFFPVMGGIMRFLGAVPVDRSKNTNLTGRLAEQIRSAPEGMVLVVPPSGTRGYTDYWKSGFYRIAETADIPVVCGYLDYARKEAGLGLTFKLSGDVSADMDRIRDFYADKTGRYPEKKSRIRLREEDASGQNQAEGGSG